GGVLKAFANQVSHFNEDYQFKIITRNNDYMETTPYDSVKTNEWNTIDKNVDVFYLSPENVNYGYLKTLVSTIDFDTVYIHGIYSLWFSIMPIYFSKKNKAKKIVIAAHGMLGKHALSVKSRKKQLFTNASKLFGLYKNVYFHAANIDEANDVYSVIGKKSKVIIAEEMPMKTALAKWKPREKKKGELLLASVARIAPEKNTLYAVEALKNCTEGKITYDIYGPVYEKEYWAKCEEIISKLPDNVTVNYKGSIPGDQVLDMFRKVHFMFLPTTGENFGHTILESFMAATPVIISNNTPWKNLHKEKIGWELPLDDIEVFVKKITKAVNMEQDQYDELSKHSLEYAFNFINDDTIKLQNDALFNDDLLD
ncbi:MAG: glycosyltransferase family 4 protein, partial [Bacteroidota bacterium]